MSLGSNILRALGLKRRRGRAYQEKLSGSFEERCRQLESAIPPDAGSPLDIGCNLGDITAWCAARGLWTVGIDSSEVLVTEARAFSADTTAPSLSSLVTRDTDGDGFIDRLVASFSENVNETSLVSGNFAVSAGSISSVVDDGTAGNPVIWVNLTDNVLYTDAIPTLTIAAGGIQDLAGNPNSPGERLPLLRRGRAGDLERPDAEHQHGPADLQRAGQ